MKSVALLALALLAAPLAQAQDTHGVALSSIDHSVKPGDNFFLYANGMWIKNTELPADRASIGSFSIIADRTDKQVAGIIADAAKANAAEGTDTRRIADLYASFMDTATIDTRGLAPIKPELDRIAAIKTQHDLARVLGLTLRADVDALNSTNYHTANLFGLWVAPGFNDPDHYAPYLLQGGDVLPSRDYYLSETPHMKDVLAKYTTHVATMFKLAGFDHPEERAAHVLELEKAIAAQQISLADDEDIHRANNLWTAADFAAKAPGLDWAEYFRAAGLGAQKTFYVWQPTAFKGESALVVSTPLDAWKDYLTYHALEAHGGVLPKPLADEDFAFFGTTLSGTQQQRPRDRRAIGLVNAVLGDAVGKLFVRQYFSPEA